MSNNKSNHYYEKCLICHKPLSTNDLIIDVINLGPICELCHQDLQSGNIEIKLETFLKVDQNPKSQHNSKRDNRYHNESGKNGVRSSINKELKDANHLSQFEQEMPKNFRKFDIGREELSNKEKELLAKDKTIYEKTPKEIVKILDKFVVGQKKAKKALATIIFAHLTKSYQIQKDLYKTNNMLFVGPTGSGKTYMIQTIARELNLPIVIADATSFTQTGYKGKELTSILESLFNASGKDMEKTEKGIVFIDEVDKLKIAHDSNGKDINGEEIQNELLKMIEGSKVLVPYNNHEITIDTTNILFVFSGAFTTLNETIEQKHQKENTLGFNNTNKKEKYKFEPTHEDIIKFGFKHEFIGRISRIITLDKLTEDDLIEILTSSEKSSIQYYKNFLKLLGVDVVIHKSALREIAKRAIKNNTGARGLDTELDTIFESSLYDIPNNKKIKKVKITKDVVLNKQKPEMVMK